MDEILKSSFNDYIDEKDNNYCNKMRKSLKSKKSLDFEIKIKPKGLNPFLLFSWIPASGAVS